MIRMINIIPFTYSAPQPITALEVTIARANTAHGKRWYPAFVDADGTITVSRPDWDKDSVTMSFVTEYHARVQAWADAKKWIAQGMTVVYRGDLEPIIEGIN
jgi:hypothetical protein